MLYYTVRFVSNIGVRVFFRKIYVSNLDLIQDDKPIIFAVNHPTAFLDPVLIEAFIKTTVHFIVRGDVFNNKIARAILTDLKMIPIFRFRDGYSNLKSNQGSMDFCYKTLSQRKNILILAEGETKHEKRLRPIQKGTARMAFGAIEKYGDLDVLVVPIGVNYTDSNRFRSEVMIEIGEAIHVKELVPLYREDPRKAIKQLTDAIEVGMRKHVIHIADEKDDEMVNHFLMIQRNDIEKSLFPAVSSSNELLKKEHGAVEIINSMDQKVKEQFRNAIQDYQRELNYHACKDVGIAQVQKYHIVNTLIIFLGFVPFVFGVIMNGFPLWVAVYFADSKVKKIEFHSSMRYVVGMLGYIFYWLLFFVMALVSDSNLFLSVVFIAPFLGMFSLFYSELLAKWRAAKRVNSLSKEVQGILNGKRAKIFKNLRS